jgi:hypothetical protein
MLMEQNNEPVTPDELESQKSELLPDREAMSLLRPLPVEPTAGDIVPAPPEPDPGFDDPVNT